MEKIPFSWLLLLLLLLLGETTLFLGETHYIRTDGSSKTLSDITPIARAKVINS